MKRAILTLLSLPGLYNPYKECPQPYKLLGEANLHGMVGYHLFNSFLILFYDSQRHVIDFLTFFQLGVSFYTSQEYSSKGKAMQNPPLPRSVGPQMTRVLGKQATFFFRHSSQGTGTTSTQSLRKITRYHSSTGQECKMNSLHAIYNFVHMHTCTLQRLSVHVCVCVNSNMCVYVCVSKSLKTIYPLPSILKLSPRFTSAV